ncbi:MAG: cupin domain-containing protein [Paracoccaceae bacterium]
MLIIDDEKVRITRFDFNPGQETGWHVHEHNYVITAITDCFMVIQHPDGTQTRSEVQAGSVYSRASGVRHNVINDSNEQMSFIEIEIINSQRN